MEEVNIPSGINHPCRSHHAEAELSEKMSLLAVEKNTCPVDLLECLSLSKSSHLKELTG